ncbi:hypothetical protein ACVW0J_003879 [Bradyrhizobium sp. i1.7.7]
MLPDCGEIDVIFDGDVDSEPFAQRGPHVQAIQSGDIGRDDDAARRWVDHPRTSHHAAAQALRGYGRTLKQGILHAIDLCDHGSAAVAGCRFDALGDDLTVQIGKCDVQFRAAKVDTQHEGGIRPERIGDGASPHAALDLTVLMDPAVALEITHHFGDGLLGQARAAGDFGARYRAIAQQALDHKAHGLLSRNGR